MEILFWMLSEQIAWKGLEEADMKNLSDGFHFLPCENILSELKNEQQKRIKHESNQIKSVLCYCMRSSFMYPNDVCQIFRYFYSNF